jgi:hypothetical protein
MQVMALGLQSADNVCIGSYGLRFPSGAKEAARIIRGFKPALACAQGFIFA